MQHPTTLLGRPELETTQERPRGTPGRPPRLAGDGGTALVGLALIGVRAQTGWDRDETRGWWRGCGGGDPASLQVNNIQRDARCASLHPPLFTFFKLRQEGRAVPRTCPNLRTTSRLFQRPEFSWNFWAWAWEPAFFLAAPVALKALASAPECAFGRITCQRWVGGTGAKLPKAL